MPCVMMSKFFQCSSSSNLRFLHYKVIDLLIIERISIKFKPISDDPCCQYRWILWTSKQMKERGRMKHTN
jgi:hypothetical protein